VTYKILLAFLGVLLALIGAVEELAVEQLDCDDGKDELENKSIFNNFIK